MESTQTMNAHGERNGVKGVGAVHQNRTDITMLKTCTVSLRFSFFLIAWSPLSVVLLLETFEFNFKRDFC